MTWSKGEIFRASTTVECRPERRVFARLAEGDEAPMTDSERCDSNGGEARGEGRLYSSAVIGLWRQLAEASETPVAHFAIRDNGAPTQSDPDGYGARFVCHPLVLESAVADIIDLACSQGATAIVERLARVPVEAKGKLEIIRNAVSTYGSRWCDDTTDFVLVTLALTQLQLALRQIGQLCADPLPVEAPRIKIVVAGNDTHTFPAAYLEEMLRIEGWCCELIDNRHGPRLEAAIRCNDCDLVGLVWSDPNLVSEIGRILDEIIPIISKKDIRFISGGHAAMTHSKWLMSRGVADVCKSFDAAIDVAGRHVRGRLGTSTPTLPT